MKTKTPKIYLLTGEQRDGEHEHYVYCMVKASSDRDLNKQTSDIFAKDEDDLFDHREKGFFSYGDALTITTHKGTQEIKESDAEVLHRLGVVHYWTPE